MSVSSVRVGNVEIVALVDCQLSAPTRAFFPDLTPEDWQPYGEYMNPDGKSFMLTVTSFLVRSGGKTILIDTGIGNWDRPYFPPGQLPERLRELGVSTGDIDVVLATHIHVDHVGWHTRLEGETPVPMFPSSTYIFARQEWDFFTSPQESAGDERRYVRECVVPLGDSADVQLIDGEHALTDELTLLPTPGHTPAHTSIAIMSAGETAVIIGDVCHHPAQVVETEWSPIADMNPALSAQSRASLIQRIEEERALMIAGHFPAPGFGRLVRVDGKRSWRAL